MQLQEYERVKNLSYREYCDYLQKKYGKSLGDYMTKSWNKNKRITRTKEGLIVHHKYEDCAVRLSDPECAIDYPFEWQKAENLVYCDYLEHLFLHMLICESSSKYNDSGDVLGIQGIIEFLVPELNDWYSGFQPKDWRVNCYNAIIDNKEVYLTLLKRFKEKCYNYPLYDKDCLFTSFNVNYGLWNILDNVPLFNEIKNL